MKAVVMPIERVVARWIFLPILLTGSAGMQGQDLIQNGSFESPALGPGNYRYGVSGAGWTFSPASLHGGSGITTTQSLFTYDVNSGFGTQMAFLQADGNAISQSVIFPNSSRYALSFSYAGRTVIGGNLTFSVEVDNTTVGTFFSTTAQPFVKVGLQFDATEGTHTLSFRGIDTQGFYLDQTAFIDRVQLFQVPEPGTAWLLSGGLVLAGVWRLTSRPSKGS